jgi:hypothetical protein
MSFLYMCDYGTLNTTEVILSRRRGKRENNGGDELNWDTLFAYVEMSQ